LTAAAATATPAPARSRPLSVSARPAVRNDVAQQIVVGAADRVQQEDRVQADEDRGAHRVGSAPTGDQRDQPREADRGDAGQRFVGPQRHAQGHSPSGTLRKVNSGP
jgi:hypothetical protein